MKTKRAFKFKLFAVAALLVTAFIFVQPAVSYADGLSLDIDSCNSKSGNGDLKTWEFASKIVYCLQNTVMKTTLDKNGFLDQISKYMSRITAVIITFAVLVFGIRIAGGDMKLANAPNEGKQGAINFLLRLGLIWFFSYNLGGFGHYLFEIMNELICMVAMPWYPVTSIATQAGIVGILEADTPVIVKAMSSGVLDSNCYPWNFMDHFLGKLFGFGEHILLTNGLLGIVSAALFSSTAGILVFFTGLMAFVDILFMIVRVIFTYLSCVLVVAFMIIISPLVLPIAVFKFQEGYFKKWLDITITAVLIPMMLFAFVGMFMGIYDVLVDRLINILGGVDSYGRAHFDAYWRLNEPKFSWMMPTDPNLSQDFEKLSNATSAGSPAVQQWINPYARRAIDTGLFNAPGVNFGESGIKILQQLALAFLGLFIFSSLMKSMIGKIPEIVQGIVGASLSVAYQPASFESGVKNAINKAKDSATSSLYNRSQAPARNTKKKR